MITGKYLTPIQMCNNSTLQRKDKESHHKEDDIIIHHIAPVVSAADDSLIKVICDDTDSIILLPYFYLEEQMTVKKKQHREHKFFESICRHSLNSNGPQKDCQISVCWTCLCIYLFSWGFMSLSTIYRSYHDE